MRRLMLLFVIIVYWECAPLMADSLAMYDPSAINRAIAGNVFLNVNIWHNNALISYSNPATTAFHQGLAWAYTTQDFRYSQESELIFTNSSSLISFSHDGIAIKLPAPNNDHVFGMSLTDTGQSVFDSSGNEIGTYTFYDTKQIYGLAFNPIDIYRSAASNRLSWLDNLNIAVGADLNKYRSEFKLEDVPADYPFSSYSLDAITLNIGGILHLRHAIIEDVLLEGVCGYSVFNVGKTQAKATNHGDLDSEDFKHHRALGFAAGVSIDKALLGSLMPYDDVMWFDELFSLRYFNSQLDEDIWDGFSLFSRGHGTEFGIFDTIFVRKGRYDNKTDRYGFDTHGWGIKLHYKNIASFSYNYAKYSGATDLPVGMEESNDMAITLDIMRLKDVLTK